jgi:Protein kinase domain
MLGGVENRPRSGRRTCRERSEFLRLEISNFNARSNLIAFAEHRRSQLKPDHHSPADAVGRFRTTRWSVVLCSAEVAMTVRAMSTQPQRICPTCGNELGAMEFCPVCMLRQCLSGGVQSGEASGDTLKPKPEQELQRFENYELVTGEGGKPVELGRGAMGVTYKAFDVDLRCPVTLKVISERYLGDESARLRFLREARAAARLRHSNVASVLHLGRTGSGYFYAMEFVEGETLANLIRRSGRLEVKLALEITSQVAAGLEAVHEQKLVHRDWSRRSHFPG